MTSSPHPLTDKKCEILSHQPFLDPETDVEATIHDMRVAADWQLEQVIEFIKKEDTVYAEYIYEAMRPQEDNS